MRRRRSIFDIITEYMEELERMADQLFEARLIERPGWDSATSTLEPLTNMFVTATEVIITADLPYVEGAAISVKPLREKVIEINAKTRCTIYFKDLGVTHRRGEFSSFYAQLTIPVPVDTSKITTRFKNGILEVRIPRKLGYPIEIE